LLPKFIYIVSLFKVSKMLEVSTCQLDEETFYGVKKVNIRGKSTDTPKKTVNWGI